MFFNQNLDLVLFLICFFLKNFIFSGTQELHQVLYPRTKATYVCLQELHDYVTSFYDVTIAYNNTRDAATGQRTTSPGMPGK